MPFMEVEIRIKLKEGISDPEGENTKKALRLLGFEDVLNVHTLKTFRIKLDDSDEKKAVEEAKEMCKKLLANPVIHDYEIRVKK
ncbi:MAG: phosphoribosylformylglycinamidine synthase subunit PurS [Candidatus Methanolliviera sp. GoM_asphalt]|nr:MAG: phosphoribosylformylglycinamidine synthase subunit PurS [Candidatus Methanolliviera sp. GoM_asphalt]